MSNQTNVSLMTPDEKRALLAKLLDEGADLPEMEPLSYAQERIWFMEQLHPGTSTYNLPTVIPMQGHSDSEALEQALQAIVDRHESLRTTFSRRGLEPVQVIWPRRKMALEVKNLRRLLPGERDREANRLSVEEAFRPFDLWRGPLLRAVLLLLTDSDSTLLLTMHHIVSDGWSIGVLRAELDALYPTVAAGRPSPLPPLRIQYRDFARWQREQVSGATLERHLAYWREQLRDAPQLIALPVDRPRPAIQQSKGWVKPFSVPRDVASRIRDLSQEEGATLFMTLLAVFYVFLHRHTGQEDLLVGAPVANRNRPDIEPLIGFFVNTLVFRVVLDDAWTFRDLVREVRRVALDVYGHQDLPFEKIVEDLQPERDLSRNPITQVVFAFQGAAAGDGTAPPLDLPVYETQTAKFDLTLSMGEVGNTLSGALECNAGLFDWESAERLAGRLTRLIEAVAKDPDRRIDRLPILQSEEEVLLRVEWNRTEADFPNACFHEVYESQVDARPDAIAAIAGEDHLTYAELDARANQLAHYIRRLGARPEARIAICVERSLDMPISILGVMKSGAAYVPLDPRAPERRNRFILADASVELVLTQSALSGPFTGCDLPVVCLDAEKAVIARESRQRPGVDLDPLNLAYAIYTSGSTGQPKGIFVPHRGVVNMGASEVEDFGIETGDRLLQMAPLIFDVSIWEMAMTWFAGATMVFASEEEIVVGNALLEKRINKSAFIPSLLASLDSSRFPDLTTVLSVGEACTAQIVQQWAPGRRLVNVYGPTETTGHCTTIDLVAGERITIGRPIHNARVYVLSDSLELAPIGVPGEIHISSVGMTRGYVGRAGLTAERFVPDPFSESPGGRLYKTGDLGKMLPDGRIEYLGRGDHQVKLRGFRIELGEIEAVMCTMPGIVEAVAVVREDRPGDPRIAAYVVPEKGVALDELELRAWLRQRLPDYMMPANLVALDELPLNLNRKIDRAALPVPDGGFHAGGNRSGELVGETQIILAGIWEELLGTPVGPKDNFFDLGGHSLLATQILVRISTALRVDIPMRTLFLGPTLEELAYAVDASPANSGETDEGIRPIDRSARALRTASSVDLSAER